jgi:Fe-S oxidoreductase
LWPDTFTNYFHPEIGHAALEVLQGAGFNVVVPQSNLCCGRPLYDFGMLDQAKQYLRRIMDSLGAEIDAGLPIVFMEPSCASVFRDELGGLFPSDSRAARLRGQTFLFSEFLQARAPGYQPPARRGYRGLSHGTAPLALMTPSARNAAARVGVDLRP